MRIIRQGHLPPSAAVTVGEGHSGTGRKADGPRYLHRFSTERTISTDTTAAGGNATLLSLQDEIEGVTG
jgi:RHH-type transcriptional regulator, proline utilization regulon repressor / proline dehydrogenase / delta 1-pyrroline-5-carboxylate dehydrogenase